LFDLRAALRISFCCRGLTGKKGNGLRGIGQQLASTAKGTMLSTGQFAKFITAYKPIEANGEVRGCALMSSLWCAER